MAALISDFISDISHFQHNHKMLNGSIPHSPRPQPTSLPSEPQQPSTDSVKLQESSGDTDDKSLSVNNGFVSPPSSSKSDRTRHKFMSQENILRSSFQFTRSAQNLSPDLKRRKSACLTYSAQTTLPRSSTSLGETKVHSGDKIKVQNLAHIQTFTLDDSALFSKQEGRRFKDYNSALAYEISSMPITDVIEMVAGLLTKIVMTNDRQNKTRNRFSQSSDNAVYSTDNTFSVSAFHGKNVPNITILSYLSRIHKYCPTTYEVFLSLLIYFDRMTEKFNKIPNKIEQKNIVDSNDAVSSSENLLQEQLPLETPQISSRNGNDAQISPQNSNKTIESTQKNGQEPSMSRLFVVDSYNIHRLVIAGVTCASKFFSDVFYTNSRYAKVGGLPLPELNHLELQFLLLNDFRLFVQVEEFEVYGTMLVEFYAREVINQKQELTPVEIKYSKDSGPSHP